MTKCKTDDGHEEGGRIVGLLVPEARVKKTLDFFGSWYALEPNREKRYDELPEDLIAERGTELAIF